MLNAKEIALLQNCFLFSGEDSKALAALCEDRRCTLQAFSKGAAVFDKNEHMGSLGILLSGRASALCTEQGKGSIKTFSSGELFGAAGVFCEKAKPPFSQIKALSSCRVLFINRDKVEELLKEKPDKAIEYIRFLSGRVEFLNRRISTFTAKETVFRVAKYLSESCDEQGICKKLNFSAMAKSLDISRASLYRAKNELIKLKVISVDGKAVRVLDREALNNIK